MSQIDVLCSMQASFFDAEDAQFVVERKTGKRRGEKNMSSKKKRKKNNHGADESRAEKNESFKKKRKKNKRREEE